MLTKSPASLSAVDRGDLIRALRDVCRVVDKSTTIPILSCVLIAPGPGGEGVTLTGTDLERWLTVTIPGTVTGKIAVDAHALLKRAGNYPEPTIELRAKDGTTYEGVAGNLRFTVAARDPGDFPDIKLAPKPLTTSFDNPEVIGWAIERCNIAVSTEETRYYLNGIFMGYERRNAAHLFRTVATDGHRLVRCWLPEAHTMRGAPLALPAPEAPAEAKRKGKAKTAKPRKAKGDQAAVAPQWGAMTAIVPRESCRVLHKLLQRTEGKVQLASHGEGTNEHRYVFAADDWRLVTKVIDGSFPDYARVLPPESEVKTSATFTLSDALDALQSMPGRSPKGTAPLVLVEIGEDSVTFTVRSTVDVDGKEVREETTATIDAKVKGPKARIAFNRRYLVEMFDGANDNVRMRVIDATSPAYIDDADEPDIAQLCMPMRW